MGSSAIPSDAVMDHAAHLKTAPAANGRDATGSAIRAGVMGVLAFSPLAFGAVHSWAYGIAWGVLWSLVALWMAKAWVQRIRSKKPWVIRWIQVPFHPLVFLFAILVLFQCVPLPSSWVGRLQPHTLEIHQMAGQLSGALPSTLAISLYPHRSWVEILHYWSYGALFFLALYHLRTRTHLQRVAYLWLALGAFEALYGLVEHLRGTHRIWWWTNTYASGVHGTFINRDHLAGYLEMTILVTVGMLLALRAEMQGNAHLSLRARLVRWTRDERWARGILIFFFCVVMGAALLLSLSRGGVLAFTVLLLPVSLLLAGRRNTRRYGFLGLALFLGAVLYSLPLGLETFFNRFGSAGKDLAIRHALWSSAWAMVRDFPLVGSGAGTFQTVFAHFKPAALGEGLVTNAHNDWLELWAETGSTGMMLVLAGVCAYLVNGIRTWRKRHDRWGIWMGFGALAAVVVVGVHSFGEFLLHIQANALTLSGIMAWGWVVLHQHRGRSREGEVRLPRREVRLSPWLGWTFMALATGIHILVGLGMARHLAAEFRVPTEINSTVERKEITDPSRLMEAISLEPGNASRWAMLAKTVYDHGISSETARWAQKRGLRPADGAGDSRSWSMALLQRAIRLNPTSPQLYTQMGWVLASRPEWRRQGLAEYALKVAVYLEPANGVRSFQLGHYLLLDGRFQEADEAFRKAVRLKPELRGLVERERKMFQGKRPRPKSAPPS